MRGDPLALPLHEPAKPSAAAGSAIARARIAQLALLNTPRRTMIVLLFRIVDVSRDENTLRNIYELTRRIVTTVYRPKKK